MPRITWSNDRKDGSELFQKVTVPGDERRSQRPIRKSIETEPCRCMNQKSEVVVITGASAGVGRATVRKFAKHGARIGLIARGLDGLKGAQREAEELGSKALVFPVDIGNADRVEAAAAQIEADLGEIDIWINNAMASVFSPVKEMTPEEFRRARKQEEIHEEAEA
jgi:short-subunit dehydrogenase involved in D-alanine esterification of teichoic acids